MRMMQGSRMRRGMVAGVLTGVLAGVALAVPVLEYALTPGGPWAADTAATVEETGAYQWRVVTVLDGVAGSLFYRVVAEEGLAAIELTSVQVVGASVQIEATGTPSAPEGIVLIPAGSFAMGDPFGGEGRDDELPQHTVYVSGFYLDQYEVTKALWDDVRTWGLGQGYDMVAGAGKGANHPVQEVSWYDVVKWCNARSQKEGLLPCYYTSAAQTTIYRTGRIGVTDDWVKWGANGYRLPTEAEWEKAARGGLAGNRFPWGDTISHSQANYFSSSSYAYDVSPTRGSHPDYDDGGHPYTSPMGSFASNGYGPYDMAGNVWEWCWDWYDSGWYGRTGATAADPRGPSSGSVRVLRGGGWNFDPFDLRCAGRGVGPRRRRHKQARQRENP